MGAGAVIFGDGEVGGVGCVWQLLMVVVGTSRVVGESDGRAISGD